MAIHRAGTEPSSASDSFEADPNHLSTTVARSESTKDSNSAVALGDFTTGSDSTTSSPDWSRDAWVVDTSASEERDSSEREAKSDEVGQAALSTKDRVFPFLRYNADLVARRALMTHPFKATATMFFRPRSIERSQAPVSTLLQTPAHAKELLPK
ncbi:hypothetical protein MRX96_002148 [Rhipicephalus microplus]